MTRVGIAATVVALLGAPGEGGDPKPGTARILRSPKLSFEPAAGHPGFTARGPGYLVSLIPTEAVLFLGKPGAGPPEAVQLRWVGGNRAPRVTPLQELPGKSNYILGHDRRSWRIGVPHYARVKYEEVYPGIDLVFHGRGQGSGTDEGRELEFDFVLAPGAEPERIRLRFGGVQQVELDPEGDLRLRTSGGDLLQKKPVAYQRQASGRRAVPVRYVLKGRRDVGLVVGDYDRGQELLIDPVLSYSTYLGGAGDDVGYGIAVDGSGNMYVAGSTTSADFPTANAYQESYRGNICRPFASPTLRPCPDAFVTKLDPTGTTLLYSTYFGGAEWDEAFGLAVDAEGNAYLTGTTRSPDFPTQQPFQAAFGGSLFDRPVGDAFVTKLDAAGGLLYSTYLGGESDDAGHAIAVDAVGNMLVAGAAGMGFPQVQPVQPGYAGGLDDAFVAKLDACGGTLVFSTYLGSSAQDDGLGIAVDLSGAAYVSGYSFGSDFPTTAGALQPAKRGSKDGFVAKITPDCDAFAYSTYLGGSVGSSSANGIVVDAEGYAYLTGSTDALDFPTVNALQPANAGGADAFVSKLDPSGAALVYSTYLGGSTTDLAWGIALDSTGSAYVTGQTSSADFPTRNAVQPSQNGTQVNAFVTRLSSEGTALRYSTYLGASDPERNAGDYAHGIAVDRSSRAYVTGQAASFEFPTVGAFQDANHGGRSDAFVARIDDPEPAPAPVFSPPGGTYLLPQFVTISNAIPEATIYYTLDGSTPTTSSTRYTRPILVLRRTTIRAIATAPGSAQSPVASATYTLLLWPR
jgi:Chitobiase/beta-hexosaminidase C-terminal domain/Beta-propeller repeat